MPREELLASVKRLRELRLNGVLGDAEFLGDFAMGEVFKFTEDENFAAARREAGDGGRQELGFLAATDGLRGAGCIVEDAQLDEFRYWNRIRCRPTPEEIPGGVAGGGEKEAARVRNRAALPGAEQARKGLLHQVIHVGRRHKSAQVGAERRLMRRKLDRKPLCLVGRG